MSAAPDRWGTLARLIGALADIAQKGDRGSRCVIVAILGSIAVAFAAAITKQALQPMGVFYAILAFFVVESALRVFSARRRLAQR